MQNPIILCPTARLVRTIQADIAASYIAKNQTQWYSTPVHTLSSWLDGVIEVGLLAGNIAYNIGQPQALLTPFNEQLLWEEVITQSLKKNAFGDLFDVSGLASAAMEANRYQIAWKLHIPREQMAEESRQFLHWQRAFQASCKTLNVLESVRYFDWQLDCLAQGKMGLPAHIAFAGFDQAAPQEQRLRDILSKHGVEVSNYVSTNIEPASARHVSLDNQEAECRAAVAWAKQQLDKNPQIKLAIVSPQLSEIRNQFAALLDDTFYPASARPSSADCAKNYNFSLGTPLIQQPIIHAALNLLRLFSAYQLQQTDISAVLLSPFWSKNQQEADARAILDAKMRDKLPLNLSLNRFVDFAQKQHESGLNIPQLLTHLNAGMALSSNRAMPSQWAQNLDALLAAVNWPGERNINSLEFQAINAWQKALQALAKLDVLGKNLSPSEAVQRLQQICAEQVFQAETTHESGIQIVGIMEALSAPVDAIWVMQMNDHIWPPPARPNPLLPANIQRAAKLPGADNHIQAAFAGTIHQRLLHSASSIIFSSSKTENESQLRASPLVKNIAALANTSLAATLAEQLSQLGNADLTQLEDHIAPAIQAGDHVAGGTGLLKAQAICPAWAFYQYRLGAKALKTPSNGLDNMDRGSLVHAVLERFWRPSKFKDNEQFRHFADLRDMSVDDFTKAINIAIKHTLQDFAEHNNISSKTVLELEHERLYKLIGAWLQHEKERNVAFNIVDCEAEKKVHICGIEITLKIDRIQQLENGEQEFIDYKTGQEPKMSSWDEDRITEPQLPIYAAFGADDKKIASVQFGWVKIAEHAFIGVSTDNFEAEADKRKPKFLQQFTDWQSLLNHWKTSIEAIAQEIKMGEATVKFNNENDLMYCEVLPLLRLPERQLQFERFQKSNEQKNLPEKGIT
jgi:probable DNA repair protein